MTQQLESPMDAVLQEDLERIAAAHLPFEEMKESCVLVTGATGLVGMSLVRALLCVNRLYGLHMRVMALVRNLEKAEGLYGDLLKRPDLTLVTGDVTEPVVIEGAVDYVLHCASVTASKVMVTKPVETLMTAVHGTNHLLALAVEKQVRSFVYVSSMEMYGAFTEPGRCVTEQELGYIDPLRVRSNYPESKRLCENLCVAYHSEYGVPVKIARLAQTFGAGILPGENRVFAQFARSALAGQDIVLHTRGLSEGNYCYTRDTVMGLLTILLRGTAGEAYNVTNPQTHTTIAAMAQMVCERLSDGRSRVVFDIPAENTYGYAADTKMKLSADKLMALGWKPEVGLEEAYRRLMDSMKSESGQ